jgi:transcriptional regulator with XRE-family HTH domain
MTEPSELGAYLRARRELVQPEEVGLTRQPRRRVSGLRREELALLAGISGDYYLRLEQGKDLHPSSQVLEALARALSLDDSATAYLHQIAHQRPATSTSTSKTTRPEEVPIGVLQLLTSTLDHAPAFVQNRFMDVLAANPLATALSPNFTPGNNLLLAAFLNSGDSELYLDWDQVAEEVVAGIRPLAGDDLTSPRLAEIISELSVGSDQFRKLWARHDVRPKAGDIRRLNHPQLGRVDVRFEKLGIVGTDGQMLVIYHGEPEGPFEEVLARLATLVAGET